MGGAYCPAPATTAPGQPARILIFKACLQRSWVGLEWRGAENEPLIPNAEGGRDRPSASLSLCDYADATVLVYAAGRCDGYIAGWAFWMQPQFYNPVPWWVTAIVLPSVFLVLGALIGFMGTWVRDKVDARRARNAFLRAIRRELESLERQLDGAVAELEDSKQKMEASWHVPQFVLTLRTTVYSSQLGKLRDVADPLLLEIVEVYSEISSLAGFVDLLNRHSAEAVALKPPEALSLSRLLGGHQQQDTESFLQSLSRVGSACQILLDRLRPLRSRVHSLATKLPA